MLKEFREFISKGNVLDLAVGVLIGAAFGAIVASFVKDILTPLLGIFGKANFENMFIVLKPATDGTNTFTTVEAAQKAGAVTMNYGLFLNGVINFIIVAFTIFLVVKAANKFKKAEAPTAPAGPSNEEVLLTEIRDLLKSKA